MSFEPIISSYIEIIWKIVKKISISRFNIFGIEFSYENETKGIDERLKKIDLAKENLKEGLSAIEELEKEAERNKVEVKRALEKINELKTNKSNLEEELKSIKNIISTDVTTFKRIAGVPSENDKKRERMLGFISGIIASIVATGVISLIIFITNNYQSIIKVFK